MAADDDQAAPPSPGQETPPPAPDAVDFLRRAYANPAFRGLMQDLAAFDQQDDTTAATDAPEGAAPASREEAP